MWLWGILALLSASAYGQVDHSPKWGYTTGSPSLDSSWGIKTDFPSYLIYDKENLNFGDYDNIKAGQELIQASNSDELLNYTYVGQYIIHEYLNNIYAKTASDSRVIGIKHSLVVLKHTRQTYLDIFAIHRLLK